MKVPLRNRIRATISRPVRRRMLAGRDRFLQIAQAECEQAQQKTLARILSWNSASQYSRKFGLSESVSIPQFQHRQPICDYEHYRPWVDRLQKGDHAALLGPSNRLLMYALTSGTTADSKLIPITDRFLSDYRRGWQQWGVGLHHDHPSLTLTRIVQISSNHERWFADDGRPCGNISGLTTSMQNKLVRKLYVVPAEASQIDDAESKQYVVLRNALAEPWSGLFVTANPATLLKLCDDAERFAEALIQDIADGTLSAPQLPESVGSVLSARCKPNRKRAQQLEKAFSEAGGFDAKACWPSLTALGVWTGGSAAAYKDELHRRFGNVVIRDHGLHASEGRMTLPISDDSSSGVLEVETHFFEFVPAAQSVTETTPTLLAHELQVGDEYFILMTTASGLYRYHIRDVVRCTGFYGTTPLLEFRHKGSHISSITGEKLTESQVVESMAGVSSGLRQSLFTLTPCWGNPPGYELLVPSSSGKQVESLANEFEAQLQKHNCEYEEKRTTGRLAAVVCRPITAAVWADFRRARISRSGGSSEQFKHPYLLPDAEFCGIFWQTADAEKRPL